MPAEAQFREAGTDRVGHWRKSEAEKSHVQRAEEHTVVMSRRTRQMDHSEDN
jgi:hypothetical protein